MAAVATIPRETPKAPPPATPIIVQIPVDLVDVGTNVRTEVGDLEELTESIRQHGVLQPIRVRGRLADGAFDLVFGQRRLLAARAAGLTHITALVDPSLADVSGITQLVENLQRRDLGPLEEARAFQQLLGRGSSLTQAELARQIGRSAPYVSNALRILDLDPKVLPLVASGQLSGSHAKALASLKGKAQRDMAKQAIDYGYSAHETEERVERYHRDQKREAEEIAKLATWAEGAEAVLLEKGADKKTTTLTSTDGYGYNRETAALSALKGRGWKVGSLSASYSRGKCECDAFGVGQTWEGGVKAVRRCIVQAHYQAKNVAEGKKGQISWQEQTREAAALEALQNQVKAGMVDELRAGFKKLPAPVARILLWGLFDWSLQDWVRDHKGDRKKPDAWSELAELEGDALVDELVRWALKDLVNRYNVKLDWQAIADAFFVKVAMPAPAKKGKAKS